MSRVGKKPITIPAGVTVTVHPDRIDFEGKKGKLTTPLQPGITAVLEGMSLALSRSDDSQQSRPTTVSAGPWPTTPSSA
jgi:large subunit ribosomal protein L6